MVRRLLRLDRAGSQWGRLIPCKMQQSAKGANGGLGTAFTQTPGSQREAGGPRGRLGRAAQAVSNSCIDPSPSRPLGVVGGQAGGCSSAQQMAVPANVEAAHNTVGRLSYLVLARCRKGRAALVDCSDCGTPRRDRRAEGSERETVDGAKPAPAPPQPTQFREGTPGEAAACGSAPRGRMERCAYKGRGRLASFPCQGKCASGTSAECFGERKTPKHVDLFRSGGYVLGVARRAPPSRPRAGTRGGRQEARPP